MIAKRLARQHLITSACLHGAIVFSAASAGASPLLDLNGDTASVGGLQPRTVVGGSAAAYFNPALLIDGPAEVTVGFMLLNQQIAVDLDGRPGTQFAIGEGLENARHADGSRFDNYPISTNELQLGRVKTAREDALAARPRQDAGSGHGTLTYEVFGLVVKLFDEHLALGVHGYVPNGEFTKLRAFYNDEREQYFSNSLHPELYSDRMSALSLALGLGLKLSDSLSLGIGATLGLEAKVVAPTYVVDAGSLDRILIDMNASVNVGVTPHFGLSYEIGDRIRLSATAHAPQKVELETSFTFLLSNGLEQSSGIDLVLDYTPWQVGLGGAVDLVKDAEQTLAVACTGLFSGWSAYVDRHGARPSPSYAWSDTISATAGMRYRRQQLGTLLDLGYTPSPVPEQTGRTNYVDNDRVSGTVGAEYHFRLLDADVRVGGQAQLHHLLVREHRKLPTPTRADGENLAPELVKDELPDDAQLGGEPISSAAGLQTNNPGWPGFASGGWIMGGSVYFAVSL
jgi:long-chain fatty acid transport protein